MEYQFVAQFKLGDTVFLTKDINVVHDEGVFRTKITKTAKISKGTEFKIKSEEYQSMTDPEDLHFYCIENETNSISGVPEYYLTK